MKALRVYLRAFNRSQKWCAWRDSNPRSQAPQTRSLQPGLIPASSFLLIEVLKIESDTRHIADHPCVVARLGLERISWANQDLSAIGSLNHHLTLDDMTNVSFRAFSSLSPCVVRPFPPWQVFSSTNGNRRQDYHRPLATVGKSPPVSGFIEIDRHKICHIDSFAGNDFG